MKLNKSTTILLNVVLLLVVLVLVKSLLVAPNNLYAKAKYKYKRDYIDTDNETEYFARLARGGWEVVDVEFINVGSGSYLVLLKQEL